MVAAASASFPEWHDEHTNLLGHDSGEMPEGVI